MLMLILIFNYIKLAHFFLLSSDERDAVQKKTFTKWVNSHLARVSCRISDLYNDLRDGYMLTRLLEVLSGELLVGTHHWNPRKQILTILLFLAHVTFNNLS